MLSSILSRIFLCAFLLCIVGFVFKTGSQIINKPITIPIGRGWLTLGEPGITIDATQEDNDQTLAPEMKINYWYTNADSAKKAGNYVLGNSKMSNASIAAVHGEVNSELQIARQKNLPNHADTQIAVIVGDDLRSNDSAKNLSTLTVADLENVTHPVNHISQTAGSIKTTLRIIPVNTAEKLLFIFYSIVSGLGITALFWMLFCLFRNFKNELFFTRQNTDILRFSGFAILAPQIAAIFLNLFYLAKMHPVKMILQSGKTHATDFKNFYDLNIPLNYQSMALALGMIVLSYIFKQGLSLKTEQDLTV